MPIDVIDLLRNIQRRGGYIQDADPKIGELENIRTTTEWTGTVFQQQLVTLKRNTMLIADSNDVTLGVDQDAKTVQYSFTRKTKKRTDEEIVKMMSTMVVRVLGRGWTATHNKGGFDD